MFQCSQCGNCCKNISSKNSEKLELTPIATSDTSVVTFPDAIVNGVMLYPWEKKRIIKLADKFSIKLRIVPFLGYFSKELETIFIVLYSFLCQKCPFLNSSNKCNIYNKRPMICKAFPICEAGFTQSNLMYCTSCPNIKNIFDIPPMSKIEQIRWAYFKLGECYVSALKIELFWEIITANLLKSQELGLIKWNNFKFNYQKQFKKYHQIDFFDFLILKGVYSKKKLLDDIKRIEKMHIIDIFKFFKIDILLPFPAKKRKVKFIKGIKNRIKTIDIAPMSAAGWIRKGNIFNNLEKYQDALNFYNRAIDTDPNNASAWFKKGNVFVALKKFDNAIDCYNKVNEINPNAEVWSNKGTILAILKKYENALVCYNTAIEINPTYVKAWLNKGNLLFFLEKYEHALICYNKAIEINSNNTEVKTYKGLALIKLKRIREAEIIFDEILKIFPKSSEVYYNKACIKSILNNKQEAINLLKTAVELDSKYKKLAKLEQYFENIKDLEEFRELINL
ncbi:MAG: tetratricopeptide repeat protein [Promethearchaeota archaeon]